MSVYACSYCKIRSSTPAREICCHRLMLLLFVQSFSDDSATDQSDDVEMPFTFQDRGSVIGRGPHLKLSRGEELYSFEQEFKMINEQKFICSLDLNFCI